jgi:glycosyltransferase involved in cell wall biosynthesis
VSAARPLTIGIDARAAVEEPGGRGRYVRELLRALDRLGSPHRYLLYARAAWDEGRLGSSFEWRLRGAPDPAWHVATAVSASRATDVFLSTNSYLTAWFTWTPTVLVAFDMVAFLPGTAAQRRAALIERATLRVAARRASAITSISEATKRDLAARYPAAGAKTEPIALAADESFAPVDEPAPVLERHGVATPYVLALGTLEPRKNLPRLIEAFASLSEGVRNGRRLVLVGASGWDTAQTEAAIGRHADLVQRLGHVPDADLPALYSAADLFAYPSLYEGFGLPVLEAMRCGTAVLTSNVSSLPEVAGDAAFYVDPLSSAAIAQGLEEALGDRERRGEIAARGARRAERFSWAATASATLALLEAAAAR